MLRLINSLLKFKSSVLMKCLYFILTISCLFLSSCKETKSLENTAQANTNDSLKSASHNSSANKRSHFTFSSRNEDKTTTHIDIDMQRGEEAHLHIELYEPTFKNLGNYTDGLIDQFIFETSNALVESLKTMPPEQRRIMLRD